MCVFSRWLYLVALTSTGAACTEARYLNDLENKVNDARSLRELLPIQNQINVNKFNSSAAVLQRRSRCFWCPCGNFCFSPNESRTACWNSTTNTTLALQYEYNCPLGPNPYPNYPPTLLPSWMSRLFHLGLLGNATLLDLCLPGTHDSLSYDLSLTVSTEGLDGLHRLSDLLHALSGGSIKVLPGELEEFFRLQAKTQQLTLSQQLDNGIRFLDLRIMMERGSSSSNNSWYSIHFMQSNHEVFHYLQELRQWLDQHEHEIVVMWLSKQGDTAASGTDQYPNVSPDDKDNFWRDYVSIMDGLLLDNRESDIRKTSLADLIIKNHRLITFCSDYEDFTKTAPQFALDAKRIENTYDAKGVFDEPQSLRHHMDYLRQGAAHNAMVHSRSGFTLLAMNTAGTSWQVTDAAIQRFLPWRNEELVTAAFDYSAWKQPHEKENTTTSWFESCASRMNIPGVKNWCPQTLLDIAQLSSYYNQIVLESALTNMNSDKGIAFPNALYLDALDYNGTVRVGTQLLDGSERHSKNDQTRKNAAAQSSYVDTILTYNIAQLCRKKDSSMNLECELMKADVKKRHDLYPLILWEQPELGRHVTWPPQSTFE
jgi:hypothetical protein